ncbi:MAG: hypothetical protein U0572_09790 [Phycisphaerales bacterium]
MPINLGPVAKVVTGLYHTGAVKADGTLVFWGYNRDGQCNVPANIGSIAQVAAGYHHTVALSDPFEDCNANGIDDDDEIAVDPLLDCDGDGTLDSCQLRVVASSAVQSPFGTGVPLVASFADLAQASGAVTLTVSAAADFGSPTEFVTVTLNGTVLATLFAFNGHDCPAIPDSGSVLVPAALFNAAVASGSVQVVVQASGAVSSTQCASSSAQVTLDYARVFDDCDGNGVWDACDIASGSAADCNGNGIPDACESGLPDCNGNGIPDPCDIANGAADENSDGVPDECNYARGDFDLDGHVGGADLAFLLGAWGSSIAFIDINGDGVVNGADLAILLGNWG